MSLTGRQLKKYRCKVQPSPILFDQVYLLPMRIFTGVPLEHIRSQWLNLSIVVFE